VIEVGESGSFSVGDPSGVGFPSVRFRWSNRIRLGTLFFGFGILASVEHCWLSLFTARGEKTLVAGSAGKTLILSALAGELC
jgi:hypothetical protein